MKFTLSRILSGLANLSTERSSDYIVIVCEYVKT